MNNINSRLTAENISFRINNSLKAFGFALAVLGIFACSSGANDGNHQRADIIKNRDSVIEVIGEMDHLLAQQIKNSFAYAVFSNRKIDTLTVPDNLFIGTIRNNNDGQNYYLLADQFPQNDPLSDYVLVFKNRSHFDEFISYAKPINQRTDLNNHQVISLNNISVDSYLLVSKQSIKQLTELDARFWQSKRLMY